jgi:hypothetical protein
MLGNAAQLPANSMQLTVAVAVTATRSDCCDTDWADEWGAR